MNIVITEGYLVGHVVHTLTVIFRKIAQYPCKKYSENPKRLLQLHDKSVQN